EYVVERSTNAVAYAAITHIMAYNGGKSNNYSYTDVQALSGSAWYRLKMTDKDGSSTYSEAKLLSAKQIAALLLKENPVKNNLVISHPETGINSYIQLISVNGGVIVKQQLVAGITQTTINISAVNSGVYYI